MTVFDSEVRALAVDFWRRSGISGPYPRSLEPAVYVVLPIAVLRVPRLRLKKAISWLNQRGIEHRMDGPDRPLHGYLIARGGIGVVFLDGTDAPDEQLFSLAHEVAHFLYEYLYPRTSALRAFGSSIVEALDGLRSPTPEERLAGVLRGVPLGMYTHLGRRSNQGSMVDPDVLQIEDKADQLALELLAPLAGVVASVRSRATVQTAISENEVVSILQAGYGLPAGVARIYARTVTSAARSSRSFREWLGA
jgi:hypothetical protein